MSKSNEAFKLSNHQSLNSYMKQIKNYPLISASIEKNLAELVFYENDTHALYKLVESNLRYVVKLAKYYSTCAPHSDMLDLIQEGNLGLIHAIKKFNPTKGYRLLTYATSWIKAYIKRSVTKSLSVVNHSSEDEGSRTDISLDTPVDDSGFTFVDMLQDLKSNQGRVFLDNEKLDIVEKAMKILNQRERYIIENRFITENVKTLKELGSEFGVSREYIRQLEEKAKQKMHVYANGY